MSDLKAGFIASTLSGDAPLTVQFTDATEGETIEHHWDFGDGSTSRDQHPTHTFVQHGKFTVTLLVIGADAKTRHSTDATITVLSKYDDVLPDLSSGAQQSSLLRILSQAGARGVLAAKADDLGVADQRPYPFLAMVGQTEMRMALLLAVINPAIGGVLLIGPRGTGKTTAVRSLTNLLPEIEVSDCEEGVLSDDLRAPSAKLLYPDCYERFQGGQSISHYESVKLVELPLNARLEDVVGGVNERVAVQQQKVKLERGILGRADRNLLYIDEVNLLDDEIVDAILDAAAQGTYTVRRGAMSGTYSARFVLIGSMNPEEGRLRPQILDRFGLRVNLRGLTSKEDRVEIYRRVREYRRSPAAFIHQWELATADTRDEIAQSRELLKETIVDDGALDLGMQLVQALEIDSHRAEYTMFEAARAHAAADGRKAATVDDIRVVAPLALRQRRSEFMSAFFELQKTEDDQIHATIERLAKPAS